MTTGGPSDPGRGGKVYMGRTRGLRQGGRKMAAATGGNGGGKPPLGSGARFKNLVGQLSKRPGVTDPKRLAAVIGQKKYGAGKMSQMAAKNRGKG